MHRNKYNKDKKDQKVKNSRENSIKTPIKKQNETNHKAKTQKKSIAKPLSSEKSQMNIKNEKADRGKNKKIPETELKIKNHRNKFKDNENFNKKEDNFKNNNQSKRISHKQSKGYIINENNNHKENNKNIPLNINNKERVSSKKLSINNIVNNERNTIKKHNSNNSIKLSLNNYSESTGEKHRNGSYKKLNITYTKFINSLRVQIDNNENNENNKNKKNKYMFGFLSQFLNKYDVNERSSNKINNSFCHNNNHTRHSKYIHIFKDIFITQNINFYIESNQIKNKKNIEDNELNNERVKMQK